ncbi:tripartite tricarboxylate transporter TctB family protein [Parasedimentitalea maritima]|uniref:Tripartite tricarboxylate transporter TctB family protein n=1 Tax=Parasedimentitalea maritima TaxID=2578117 RepID=A0ABY2UTT0_9RHOB|nr:tripartite tricarboxylate transporter TctB family protein [Zongyanglinia marina]TLP60307.1 tripartite tricarboxylate transporter TctB family protein [Zongyanglinia marina]
MNNADENHSLEAGEIARFLSYIAILAASVALYLSAEHIPSSRFEVLGAAAFPRFVFAAIFLIAVIAIVDSLRKIPGHAWGRFGSEVQHWLKTRYLVIVCFVVFAAYLLLVPILGFSIASFAFVFGLQLILMPRKPLTLLVAVLVALAFSFGLNAMFAEFFNVFLPRGDFLNG